jgi:hypothetical protein
VTQVWGPPEQIKIKDHHQQLQYHKNMMQHHSDVLKKHGVEFDSDGFIEKNRPAYAERGQPGHKLYVHSLAHWAHREAAQELHKFLGKEEPAHGRMWHHIGAGMKGGLAQHHEDELSRIKEGTLSFKKFIQENMWEQLTNLHNKVQAKTATAQETAEYQRIMRIKNSVYGSGGESDG